MRLKELEIHGFKSFADRTVLSFDKQVSVIVGPNGSGKSNISDAIRWVLGEQSVKSLRGNKMEDVIFSGTDAKNPMNFSKVTIVFDNEDSRLPIDFKEVAVSRKVYRDGESEYRINKSSCRLKDVRELFMDTGIGKEGYSIISQGRIDEILSSKPEDRRAILDEASGTAKFKFKKEEAQKKLQKALDNLVRIRDIVLQLEDRSAFLKSESEKAQAGMRLIAELERHQLYSYKCALSEMDDERSALKLKLDGVTEEYTTAQYELSELNSKLSPIKSSLEKDEVLQEGLTNTVTELERRINKLDTATILGEERIAMKETEVSRWKDDIQTLRSSIDNIISKIEKNKSEHEKLSTIIAELAVNKSVEMSKADRNNKEIISVKNKLSELESEAEIIRNEIADRRLSENTNSNLVLTYNRDLLKLDEDIKSKQDELIESQWKIDALKTKLDSGNLRLEEIKAHYDELKASEALISRELEFVTGELASKESVLKELSYKRKVQLNIYENFEGFNKPVQAFLKEKKQNKEVSDRAMGSLAELVIVEPKYRKSIEAALGSALQNIVTYNYEGTKYLIKLLRQKSIARITFLPIDRITPRYKNTQNIDSNKYLTIASEAVSYPDEIKNIISYFLDRTLIVSDIDEAVELSKNTRTNRIVTLDGEIINTWGSVVAGNYGNYSSGQLINRKSDIDYLDSRIEEVSAEVNSLNLRYEQLVPVREGLLKEITGVLADETAYKADFSDMQKTFSELSVRHEMLSENLIQLRGSQKKRAVELGLLSQKPDGSISELEFKLSEVLKWIEITDASKRSLYDTGMQLDVAKLRIDGDNEIAKRDISICENALADLEDRLENTLISIDREEKNILLSQCEIAELKLNLEKDQNEQKEKFSEVQKLKSELHALKNVMNDKKASYDRLSESRYNMVEELGVLKSRLDKYRNSIDMVDSKLSLRREELLEEYGIEDEELENRLASVQPIETSKSKVLKLRQEIRDIGHFSYDSIEEYKLVYEQLEFYRTQEDDLLKSKEDIKKVIAKLNIDIMTNFNVSMNDINMRFNKIFSILFEGGSAKLVMVGDDMLSAGVDIEVQPPGKKLQSLSLLSGGERALTAVALLFAIFETRPAPFCILDEVDAALDEANIGRYVKYLKSFTGIQFIIITHRKPTMEMADTLYGVTMEEEGISKMLTLSLNERS